MKIFRNPEAPINKLMEDLPRDASNRIIYSELGKYKGKGPDKLLSAFQGLESKGLSSYVNPELTEQISQLAEKNARENSRNIAIRGAQKIGGALAGATLASMTPFRHMLSMSPGVIELMAGSLGSGVAPSIASTISNSTPNSLSPMLRKALSKVYDPLRGSLIANKISGQ